jgi:peptidoglycan/xylan/chitin deacetylase (PgdA/CDA1 family)
MKRLVGCCAMLCLFLVGADVTTTQPIGDLKDKPWTLVEGGVTRGDASKKQIALIFTGGDYGEGAQPILDALKARNIKGSFFVTGDFLRKAELQSQVKRAIAGGHYVGPHSDKHPLYVPWEDRSKTLVTASEFRNDLEKNLADLRELGALCGQGPVYFIPPYEWYNQDQVNWSHPMGVLLFNFTPGSGSNRDWAPEGHKSFISSQKIIDDILAYEKKDEHGLNGFFLLLHVGSQRKDKTFLLLGDLLKELQARGYSFVRVDQLLDLK